MSSNQFIQIAHCPVTLDANIPERLSEKKNITKIFKDFDIDLEIRLLSHEIMIITLASTVTCGLTLNYGKMKNIFNEEIEGSFLGVASSG